jgi:hypothetical protein
VAGLTVQIEQKREELEQLKEKANLLRLERADTLERARVLLEEIAELEDFLVGRSG